MRRAGYRPSIPMAADHSTRLVADAMTPLIPGPLTTLSHGGLKVEIAPQAGGRIAQISRGGVEQLVGYDESNAAMISWGCYPMLPWAGRIRHGRFDFQAQRFQLPLNLGAHAIHGVGFAMPWKVECHTARSVELSLVLPQDERWPFGGLAHQRIEVGEDWLELELSVQAERVAMPVVIGWHPWFRKCEQLHFFPSSIYPRDNEGIATLPLASPPEGASDDCFINSADVRLQRAGQELRLSSDCTHWVVYDQTAYATCVEPQSGPPDAFNIEPCVLPVEDILRRRFRMQWQDC